MKRPDFSQKAVCSVCEKVGEGNWPKGWLVSSAYVTGFCCPRCAFPDRPELWPDEGDR